MKIKNVFSAIVVALAIVISASTFVSCQSKEEAALSQMEKICEIVEAEDFDSADWEKIQNEYNELADKIGECDFTDEQAKEIAKLQGRFAAAAAKQAVGSFGKMIKGSLNSIDGFVEGIEGE